MQLLEPASRPRRFAKLSCPQVAGGSPLITESRASLVSLRKVARPSPSGPRSRLVTGHLPTVEIAEPLGAFGMRSGLRARARVSAVLAQRAELEAALQGQSKMVIDTPHLPELKMDGWPLGISRSEFKERQRQRYQQFMGITLILGAAFLVLQVMGFQQLYQAGIKMEGSGAGQFLYIIFGLHGLHVAGGVIALLVMFLQTFSSRFRSYNPVPLEVMSTYWHFVDLLWIYLFVFFLMKL